MKYFGRLAALAGLILAVWVVLHDRPQAVLGLLETAGVGLVLAALVHVLPMLANARDWQLLILGQPRPTLARILQLVWIRESVNCLLPVARVGGEIVSFRLMRHLGVKGAAAAGSLVVDTQLTLISQLLFTLGGIGYLLTHAASNALRLAGNLTWGVVALTPFLVLFALIQHVGPFERFTQLLNRVTGGKLVALVGPSAHVDHQIKMIWRRPGIILQYLLIWQPLQCLATSLEIWVALRFLGMPLSLLEAVVFESLIQAISSAMFFVPGGLGVQEGGFILIGRALGLDPVLCLALAGARRVRDLLVYVPGLLAWQLAESWAKTPAAAVEASP
jgi:putative membrane protein